MTYQCRDHCPSGEISDSELIAAARAGDRASFGILYIRHSAAVRRLAQALPGDADTDWLVRQVFTRFRTDLAGGNGPKLSVRTHLLRTVWRLTGRDDRPPRPEQRLVAEAFARLPESSQLALWHTEVERDRAVEVASMLGTTRHQVRPLAIRAREQLRQNYLRALPSRPEAGCRTAIERRLDRQRAGLPDRSRKLTVVHQYRCGPCRWYEVLADSTRSIRPLLAPSLLGQTAAAAYLDGRVPTGRSRVVRLWHRLRRRPYPPRAEAGTVQ